MGFISDRKNNKVLIATREFLKIVSEAVPYNKHQYVYFMLETKSRGDVVSRRLSDGIDEIIERISCIQTKKDSEYKRMYITISCNCAFFNFLEFEHPELGDKRFNMFYVDTLPDNIDKIKRVVL